jgi:hypothetical protein
MFYPSSSLNRNPNRIKINLKYFLFGLAILTTLNSFAQVGIGTNTPATSAALEVTSKTNNKGLLIPRITATQKDAISNPAEGLMVYQTSAPAGFYFYTGSVWKLIMTQTDLDTKLSTADATLSLSTKVNKVTGKDLSSNDYTTTEKTKLAAITGTNTGDQDLTNYASNTALALKANTTDVNTDLATKVDKVTGKDLSSNDYTTTEKTKLAAITGTNSGDQDLSAYATLSALTLKSNTADVTTLLAQKANSSDITTALDLKEYLINKVLDISIDSTSDIKYPSVKAVKTYVDAAIAESTTPLSFTAPLSKSVNIVSVSQANGSVSGYLSSSDWTSFTNKIDASQKAANNGVATLGNDGKIPSNQIPAISFQSANVVSSETAMLGLSSAVPGSIAIRTDDNNNYVLSSLPASTSSNWIKLLTPASVTSVNGFAGSAVVLTTNEVAEGSTNKYYTDAKTRGALSVSAPLVFNNITGAFSLPQAATTTDGFLTAADWITFKNKQNALTADVDYVTPNGNAATATTAGTVTTATQPNITSVGTLGNLTVTNPIVGSITGNATTATLASTVTTNANLTGDVISSGSNITRIDAGRVTNAMLAGSIDLTSKVSGILPSSNGGTGNGFTNITGPTTSVKTFTLPDADATILTSNAPVSVAQGGTGQTTYTNGELLIGNTTGNTLTKATLTEGTGISISNASGTITIASTNGLPSSGNSTGDMLYWNGTAWVKVAAGSNGQILTFLGNTPTWQKPAIPSLGPNDVFNLKTGKVWMDRNLGATKVAGASDDAASYGDLYQWGRGTDGHQIRTSSTTAGPSNSTTPGSSFLFGSSNWYSGTNPDNFWQGVSGNVNNPCPSGYRLPTNLEWDAERLSWASNNSAGAFASPLKLPLAGRRYFLDGSLSFEGTNAGYLSSTVNGTNSQHLGFGSGGAAMGPDRRADGRSVRCIKD